MKLLIKGGRVVDVGDVDAMEQALHEMASPDARRQMSEWCIQKVQTFYTATKVLTEIKESLHSSPEDSKHGEIVL